MASKTKSFDWRFASRPFWIFSHIFAASVIGLFIFLGFWQLDRLGDRQEQNALVETRLSAPINLTEAPMVDATSSDLDFRAVNATVRFIDEDFVRIGNRSQGGSAGEHVVAIVELADGTPLAVNRGFVPLNANVELEPVSAGPVPLSGWLRASVAKGFIGATDSGEGAVLPRFDTERVAFRLGRPLPSVWLQVAPDGGSGLATFPDPVALPPIDDGPHLSYAAQWFIFAVLGLLFYGALLRRQASGDSRTKVTAQPIELPVD